MARARWNLKPYLVLVAIAFVVFRFFPFYRPSGPPAVPAGSPRQALDSDFAFADPPTPHYEKSVPGVLRPGQFVDSSRRRDIQRLLREPEPHFDEQQPDGVGTVNDRRNPAFYRGGTLALSTTPFYSAEHPTPDIFDPYPDYNSESWRKDWVGNFQTCRGPHGKDLDRTSRQDMVTVYRGNQDKFPYPMFGSHEEIGLDPNVCYDRYSRYGLYGYDEQNAHLNVPGFQRPEPIDWSQVNWGELQSDCYQRNADRFKPSQINQNFGRPVLTETPADPPQPMADAPSASSSQRYKSRSAVLLRAADNMDWSESHRQYLRSLIMELSLHTGTEYQVFFMLDVKDESLPIEHNSDAIQEIKWRSVPPEFHNMTILFNDRLLRQWYPKIGEHSAQYQHLQSVQMFSQLYPEFDYYWQFEFDARMIGHAYHFIDQSIQFAKKQPRKHLWERNAYFYTPGAHGTWKQFAEMVSKAMNGRDGVWGPVSLNGKPKIGGVAPIGPKPPVSSPQEDNYEWGVGEEPDLITFLPIFDSMRTSWTMPWRLYGPLAKDAPRRASVLTQWRVSKRLLDVMHSALKNEGLAYVSEMSAPSFSLLHGLKAVYVPHPIYLDGQWTDKEIGHHYNQGPAYRMNGNWDSIWNWNHLMDHIMYRTTYMFSTQAGEDLFRRWMGYPVDRNQENEPWVHTDAQQRVWFEGGELNEPQHGRLCYPAVMLHPIKNANPQRGGDLAVPNNRC